MRKFLALFLALFLVGSFISACSTKTGVKSEPPGESQTGNTGGVNEGGGTLRLGLGAVNSIGSSRDASGDQTAQAQVDTVMAAVVFDDNGKVLSVTIDNAQTRVEFDKEMKVASDRNAEYKTKVERGDDYGMARASEIGKEWYEQIAELEKWMTGKTIAEITSLDVKERDASHLAVPDVPELTSLVTITVEDYLAAVEKAFNYSIPVEGAVSVGLGHMISIGSSRDYDGQNTPMAQVDTVMAATAFDGDNRVAGTLIDNAQIRVEFDENGKVTSDKNAEYKTKVERGDDYGMARASEIGKEWYEQIAELEKWMTGKTIAEITSLDVKERDASHLAVPDVPELTSLVTITVEDYLAAVEESFANAKGF